MYKLLLWNTRALASLVFTTSGVPSPYLALRRDGRNPPFWAWYFLPSVFLSSFLRSNASGLVMLGHVGTVSLVGKSSQLEASSPLELEYAAYQKLKCLQGIAIPYCLGLYQLENFALILLTEYCGQSLTSFDALHMDQRCIFTWGFTSVLHLQMANRLTLYHHVTAIHEHGVCHGDLEPRNVVVSQTGGVFLIDFGSSENHHCSGDGCGELLDFRVKLQLDSGVTKNREHNGMLFRPFLIPYDSDVSTCILDSSDSQVIGFPLSVQCLKTPTLLCSRCNFPQCSLVAGPSFQIISSLCFPCMDVYRTQDCMKSADSESYQRLSQNT